MRSPALAIGWELFRRNRWGWRALALYLVVLTGARLATGGSAPWSLDSEEAFALVVSVPFTMTFLYLLAVFSFGLTGDVAGRASIYPTRLFTQPVSTSALAFWPMLYGTIAVALLWLLARVLAPWPRDAEVPWIWPAFLGMALLAWTQALMWLPYGLPGARVIVSVLSLTAMDAVVLFAIYRKTPESALIAGLAPLIPLGYLAARHALKRARRGEVPDGRAARPRTGRATDLSRGGLPAFPSAARAQLWLEWRRHGRSLPALVGLLLPFEVALLFAAGSGRPALALWTVVGVLLTPPFLAAFAAATVRRSGREGGDAYGLSPFLATRPLTSAQLVAAKLKATVLSTLAAWSLVALALPLALAASGSWTVLDERARSLTGTVGSVHALAIALAILAGLLLATWKQLVRSLYVGLSGREWAVRTSVFLTLSFLVALGPLLRFIHDEPEVWNVLWRALPWALALLAALKTGAALWVVRRLHRSGLVGHGALVKGTACWCLAVLGVHGLLVWLARTPLTPAPLLGLVAIVSVPLVRVSAATLALAWNRHR